MTLWFSTCHDMEAGMVGQQHLTPMSAGMCVSLTLKIGDSQQAGYLITL